MTKHQHHQQQDMMMNDPPKPTNYIRVPMEPLYERLLKKPFADSVSAIEYCRTVCAEFGFTVKQEASANRNIYVYCSREGLPDSQRNPKPSPQRKRPSKRCDCRWRVVLSENEHEEWEFRKSMNPNASEHNHEMMSPEEMVKAWPTEVNEMIIQLARQRLQTHEIREAVKQQFPDISWNERRFYNRLTEERKRIRQRGVVERSQRLLMLSARLCSVIASNEEWATCVESDLQRMFENFCQLARLTPENINTLVDLQQEMIQIDDQQQLLPISSDLLLMEDHDTEYNMGSPAKKRKSFATKESKSNETVQQKGIQMVYVPSYTIQVRSPLNRSSSIESNRRLCNNDQQQQQFIDNNNIFSLASPTSSSSSSSSMPFNNTRIIHQRLTSPTAAAANNEFILSSQQQQNNFQTTPQPTADDYASVTATTTATTSNNYTSFSPYAIPPTAFTSPPDFYNNNEGSEENRRVYGFFNNTTVKEESMVEQQQQLLHRQQQQQEYEQRMHRNYQQQASYSLPPMMKDNTAESNTNTNWS